MKKKKSLAITVKVIIVFWSLTCIVIFMYFPGSISQIYGVSLYDVSTLAEKISRIAITDFISNVLISLFGMMFYMIACLSLGMKLITILRLNEEGLDSYTRSRELLPTSFLIGNAVFSLLFLIIASLFSITRFLSIIILSLGLMLGLGQLKNFSYPAIQFSTKYEKIVTGFSIAVLAISLFQSSARISYDASSVYFSNAKLSALEHHIGYFLENTFVASISQATITYSVIIQVFGDQTARMISWIFGAVTIYLGIALVGLVGGSKPARHIFPTLALSSTAFLDLIGDGKIDLFGSAYALASVYWFINTRGRHRVQNRSLLILTGCLTGFACILRSQNVFLLGMFFLVYFLQQLCTKQITYRQLAKQAWWMFLGACGFALYHLIVNDIDLGSPFAFWSVITKINPTDGPWDYNPNTVWIYRLLYPFVVTFKNSGASLGNISPLALAFLPALTFTDIRKHIVPTRDAGYLYISAGLVLLSWILLFFTIVEVRYVFFLWIILFIPITEIIAGMFESSSAVLRTVSITWSIVLMSFILLRSIYISISAYAPVDTMGNPHCFDSALCNQVASINKVAKPGERVLVLSAFRYYLRTDLFACSTNHVEYKVLATLPSQNTDGFWLEVYRRGYKYIAYENDYTTRHLQLKIIPSPEDTPEWISLKPLYGKPGDLEIAYKINVTKPPIKVESACRKNSSGIWEVQSLTP